MGGSRYRETDKLSPSSYHVIDKNPGGAISSDTTYESGRHNGGTFKSISDTPDPDYWIKKKRGDVILHDVDLENQVRTSIDSSWTFGEHPVWGTREVHGAVACENHAVPVAPDWFGTDVANAKDRALLRAYAKMNTTDFESGVILAEAAKTGRMLRRPFGDALRLTKQMIARKQQLLTKGVHLTKASTSAWLEYRYGVRPLMMDIEGIVKQYADVYVPWERRLVARSGIGFETKSDGPAAIYVPGVSEILGRYDHQFKTVVSAGVIYTHKDRNQEMFRNRTAGLNLQNVPYTIWEIVPYSFVVDWFLEVGIWLQATIPIPGIKVEGNWVTTKSNVRATTVIDSARISVGTSPATTYYQTGGAYGEDITKTSRRVNQPLSVTPTLSDLTLSIPQSIDSAALLLARLNENFRTLNRSIRI